MNFITISFLFGSFLVAGESAKILFLLPMAFKNHKNFFRPLVHELAGRGHEITMVSTYKDEKPIENLREIAIDANAEMGKNFSEEMIPKMLAKQTAFSVNFFKMSIFSAENFFKNPEIQTLLRAGIQFDLAFVQVFLNEVGLMVASLVAKHVVSASQVGILLPTPSSPPLPLSTVSTTMVRVPSEMNFFDRLKNALGSVFFWQVYKYVNFGPIECLGKEFEPVMPTIEEAKQRICMSFVNADPIMIRAKPETPNVIAIGCMHCKPAKELPKMFTEFIDASGEDGFIYFSLGSVVQARFLSKETRDEFLKAFKQLKQKVIWKFEEEVDNLPPNVIVTPWAPQQDILGHPKIRMFLTHGGILSCQEAIYHGVPLIGIPVIGDQLNNIDRLLDLGIGESLEIGNITAEEVQTKILKVLNNPKYLLEMKRLSVIMRDQAVSSLERAVHWTEYVIRHDGADFLCSSAEELDYFQYFCLDIVTVLTVVSVTPIFIFVKVVNRFKKNK